VDAAGNVYVTDDKNDAIKEIVAAGGYTKVNTLETGFYGSVGIALDGSGNIFVADPEKHAIYKLDYADEPTLTFATTAVGSTSSDSPQTVTVANIGNAALTFPIPASGNDPGITANFTLNSSQSDACPLVSAGSSQPGTLAAGASCLLPISFAPTTGGNITGSLTLTDNNLNAVSPAYATQSIELSGTGATPPFGHLDSAVDNVTLSTTVGQSDSVVIRGWVADKIDGAPLSNVRVYIDGKLAGTPFLGLARPDVAAAKGAAYLDSGYQLTYSVAALALGSHAVTVIAIDSGGRSTTFGPLAITVAATAGPAAPTPPLGHLDSAVDSVTGSSTVGQSDYMAIRGWAADLIDGAPLSNVTVLIDGSLCCTPFLGLARPDVAAAYSNAAFLDSGYTLTYYAVAALSPGSHAVAVIATDSGGRSTTFGPLAFTVAATAGPAPPAPPFGSLDSALDSVTKSTTVAQSDSIVVRGWAADQVDGAPLSNVNVYIDGILAGKPTLGIARPDVATAKGAAYLDSGFQLSYSAAGLALGSHAVTVVAIDSGNRSTTFGPLDITVQ